MVTRLRRGTIAVNGDLHGDDRPTTLQRKSVRRQGNHSAPTSSLRKIFSLATVIRTSGRTNHSADEDRGANSPAVRYTEPDLVQSLYHRNHSLERLTEQLAMLCSQIFMWQLPNLSVQS